MIWVPHTFRDWLWLLWKALTDSAPKPFPMLSTVRISCPHCGRTY